MVHLVTVRLGSVPYDTAWELQQRLFDLRRRDEIDDVLLLVEHPHIYTIGRKGNLGHILLSKNELLKRGITVRNVDRGGDVTYHGPGQLVGYPIISLCNRYHDVHRYLRELEEVLIRTVRRFGIEAVRIPGFTGVWVGDEKLAAIGVKVSDWITMHGFALNVNTDLSFFDGIIPCGIHDRGVTSMAKILGHTLNIWGVADAIEDLFAEVFHAISHRMDLEEFKKSLYERRIENSKTTVGSTRLRRNKYEFR
ncbi:MAG: lipoyl(octanoyl) transferase LipB [Bacteroidota bacterium]